MFESSHIIWEDVNGGASGCKKVIQYPKQPQNDKEENEPQKGDTLGLSHGLGWRAHFYGGIAMTVPHGKGLLQRGLVDGF